MNVKQLFLYVFPHVEDRRFVEIQLQDEKHNVVAANVVLQHQLSGEGIHIIELRSPEQVYTKGQIT